MAIILHHRPIDPSPVYKVHAWDDSSVWDVPGTRNGIYIDFGLPDVKDPRKLKLKFRSTNPGTGAEEWESDDFVRQIRIAAPDQIWSFEFRCENPYQYPNPVGRTFRPGTVLTFSVITEKRFKGGRIMYGTHMIRRSRLRHFPELSRTDPISTFDVPLASWMTGGFHFKLRKDNDYEPDSSNRIWTPGDGNILYVKSGQVSVRHETLARTDLPLEVLFPAALGSPPTVELIDPIEDVRSQLTATVTTLGGTALFRVARYTASMYPDAVYKVKVSGTNTFERPFPAFPEDLLKVSRFVFGADGWFRDFPVVAPSTTLVIEPKPASTFTGGLTVDVGVGRAGKHETVAATLSPDGLWRATLNVVPTVPNWVQLHCTAGDEPKPYDWIDAKRSFTPPAAAASFFTAEGVYGVTALGPVSFAEPPSRTALMKAAFGDAVAGAGIFDAREMPHGPTRVGTDVYFVLHAPHAASASLVLVDEAALGAPKRVITPMSLTGDTLYWWCRVPAAAAPPNARYRFVLNEIQEVMDPAAREVLDRGNFQAGLGDDPKDPDTSWSLLLDVDAVRAAAHAAPWQTMGWETLLLYELHAKRFTDIAPAGLSPLELIADELQPINRQGRLGYLRICQSRPWNSCPCMSSSRITPGDTIQRFSSPSTAYTAVLRAWPGWSARLTPVGGPSCWTWSTTT